MGRALPLPHPSRLSDWPAPAPRFRTESMRPPTQTASASTCPKVRTRPHNQAMWQPSGRRQRIPTNSAQTLSSDLAGRGGECSTQWTLTSLTSSTPNKSPPHPSVAAERTDPAPCRTRPSSPRTQSPPRTQRPHRTLPKERGVRCATHPSLSFRVAHLLNPRRPSTPAPLALSRGRRPA